MIFKSILFPKTKTCIKDELLEEPVYFRDLNLDQIIKNITGKQEYLKKFFYTTLHDLETIQYRQEVMKDLECEAIFKSIKSFADNIQFATRMINSIQDHLSRTDSYQCNYVEKGRLLEAAKTYCEEVNNLTRVIASFNFKSRGLSDFREYILNYAKSEYFIALLTETNLLKAELATVKYCMLIKGNCIKVRKYEDEKDYSAEIEKVFRKFQQGDVKDYRKKMSEEIFAEHVEAGVLNLVGKLYPDIFSSLDKYIIKNKNFLDETIKVFSQEVQFYISYLEYIYKFRQRGLQFCYPKMSNKSNEIYNYEGFDLALANKLINQSLPVICNDFQLMKDERIIVVTGPNQGGKTTFARAFGQMQHLASLGCLVPGRAAKLSLFDQIFTHFDREESINTGNGKLQDELVRMYDILKYATSDSIIIINEILSSTTLRDAITIGKKIIEEICRLDSLCVWVTFIDELTSLNEKIVSMVSTVIPEDPVHRTFKIVRGPADGLAYAIHIAEKYQVTYDSLKRRIKT